MGLILPCGKPRASFSITGLRWSPTSQVRKRNNFFADEIKWQIRLPTRYANSQPKMTYLNQIQEETQRFMQERIKYNFLAPEKGLNLDLTVKDAEVLISASSRVRALAESGDLERIHKQCKELENRIEGDYLAVRNHIGKILVQVEEKENALVEKLEELGVKKLRKHRGNSFEEASLFDIMGLTTGDPSFDNLILVEAAA